MSDIRFNRWLHQSGTGGIYQDSSGNIGIGTSVPRSALDVQSGFISVGENVVSASGVSTFTTVNATTLIGNLTGNVTGNLTGTASTATAAATAYGLSGSPTLSGITSVSTSNLTVNGNAYPSAGPLSNRNLIINGAMQIDQRGTATGITGGIYGGPDRYKCFISGAGTWTLSQQADAPSGTGLYYSYKFQCASTGTLSSGSYLGHRMILEGYDSVRLNGQQFTISFWVKCNKTGTMTCEPFDSSSGGTQSVSKQFTINAADTWEYKTITFPANPHNYPANNAGALVLHWWLSAGSSWNSTVSTGEWTNFANGFRAYGCNIDLTDSTSNYFQITGIQLESGTVATPFEHRSYGDELARCQRYYWNVVFGDTETNSTIAQGSNYNGGTGFFTIYPPVSMRVAPSLEASNTANYYIAYSASIGYNISTLTFDSAAQPNAMEFSASIGGNQGNAVILRRQNANAILRFSAEL